MSYRPVTQEELENSPLYSAFNQIRLTQCADSIKTIEFEYTKYPDLKVKDHKKIRRHIVAIENEINEIEKALEFSYLNVLNESEDEQ